MRLAFVTPEFVTEPYFAGGLANYLGRISVALARRGHDVHVFTTSDQDGALDYHGVHVHRVLAVWDAEMVADRIFDRFRPRWLYSPYQDIKAAHALRKRWRDVHRTAPFDLVQIANVMGVGLFFLREERMPVILRLSSYRPAWDRAAGVAETLAVRLRWRIERWIAHRARYLYAPSHFVARSVQAHFRTRPVDVVESPYFADHIAPDTSVIDAALRTERFGLFFGRMTQMKGTHVLAQALPAALARHPDLQIVFLGADSRAPDGGSMRDYVRSHTAAFPGRVHLLDPVRHAQLYPFIDRARFVVLPSLIDNLPNTLLESMGHGRLVIGTTGSCFEQLIDPDHSGLLVPPGDARALEAALSRAWTMPEAPWAVMGERARESVSRLHPDLAVPALEDHYRGVLRRHAG